LNGSNVNWLHNPELGDTRHPQTMKTAKPVLALAATLAWALISPAAGRGEDAPQIRTQPQNQIGR
jgi:hypothetical protein